MRGMARDSGTRSSLLWEVERLLKECVQLSKEEDDSYLPQILLMENVPQVLTTDGGGSFEEWQLFLESLGYQNYCEVLNAKNYGIPQNRERVFMISLLGEYGYTFPNPITLKLHLKDLLENNVEEKYYLGNNMKRYDHNLIQQEPNELIYGKKYTTWNEQLYAKILKEGLVKDGNIVDFSWAKSRVANFKIENKLNPECSPTLKCNCNSLGVISEEKNLSNLSKNLRIRRLTPKECYRLMGVRDAEIDKVTCSNCQKYKQAGNSIVVNVLMAIFKELF